MKLPILVCALFVAAVFSVASAYGQTSQSGQAVVVATPTPAPPGYTSTAVNIQVSGTVAGVTNGNGTMGSGVNVPPPSAVSPIVPGAVIINSNASSVGTGNVAGSVVINNGGSGTVTGAPTPTSVIPTYVTPGTGLGTAATAGVTAPNPNPGSVQ